MIAFQKSLTGNRSLDAVIYTVRQVFRSLLEAGGDQSIERHLKTVPAPLRSLVEKELRDVLRDFRAHTFEYDPPKTELLSPHNIVVNLIYDPTPLNNPANQFLTNQVPANQSRSVFGTETHFSQLVCQKIPSDRGWRWCFETIVECYESVSCQTADFSNFTHACIQLRQRILAEYPELRKSSSFADYQLLRMAAILVPIFASKERVDYREQADVRLNRHAPEFERQFHDLVDSKIEIYGTGDMCDDFVRYGVYALWRCGSDGSLRSPIPTYVGKSYRKQGMFHRVAEHWRWWDHTHMGVTFTEIHAEPLQALEEIKLFENAMIRVIQPPANWTSWKKFS